MKDQIYILTKLFVPMTDETEAGDLSRVCSNLTYDLHQTVYRSVQLEQPEMKRMNENRKSLDNYGAENVFINIKTSSILVSNLL